MLELFIAYKKYPFPVPARVRFFNLFRYFFKIKFLENFLVNQINRGNNWWKKLAPPLYFYSPNTNRNAERNGIKYFLDLSCLIDYSIFFRMLKEPSWENLFKVLQPDFVILDVGANIGFHTLNFARICSKGFVHAFEPDNKSFKTLSANIELNNFRNVAVHPIALGAKDEKLPFYKLYINNPGANRILAHAPSSHFGQQQVDVRTCDHIADELMLQRLDLIKIDVEGFELFVLQGATNTINKYRPILFVELAEKNLQEHSLSSLDLINYIERLGYQVTDAKTMTPIDRSIQNHHTDILCFPI